jgi:hypothetical protein
MERKCDALREHWSALDEEVLRIMCDLPVAPSKVDVTGALIREARDAYRTYIEAVRRELASGFREVRGDSARESTEVPVLQGRLGLADGPRQPSGRHSVGEGYPGWSWCSCRVE